MKQKQVTFGSSEVLQIVVFTLVAVLGPLLIYPRTFGVALSFSFSTLLILEALYYVIVFSVFNSGVGLKATLLGAVFATLYRFTLATLFGLMIFAPGGVVLGDAIREGFHGYWPGYMTFILSSPFVMMSFVKWLIDRLDGSSTEISYEGIGRGASASSLTSAEVSGISASTPLSETGGVPYLPHTERNEQQQAQQQGAEYGLDEDSFAFGADVDRTRNAPGAVSYSGNGFERAVNYLGEDATVKVAAVVDLDGLEVASFERDGFSSASWSPFALSLVEENAWILERHQQSGPKRVELHYDELRVECRLIGRFILFAASERHDDDLLGVRMSQASDIVGKYISARYSEELFAGMEGNNVRSVE